MEPKKQRLECKEQRDKDIGKMFCEYVSLLLAYNLGRRILGLNKNVAIVFLGIMLLFFVIRNISIILRILKCKIETIFFFEIGVLIIYGLSYIRGVIEIRTLLIYVAYTGILCAMMLAAGSMLSEKKIMYGIMKKYAHYMLLLGNMIIVAHWRSPNEYNMSFSYIMLLPLLVFTNEFLKDKHIKDGLFMVDVLCLILLFGSRGPLLCFALFWLFRLYTVKGNITLKSVFILLVLSVVMFWNRIGSFANLLMGYLGVYSRSLNLLFNNLFYSSGRNVIWNNAFEIIKENWLFGCGVASDIKMLGQYPHNIFIELLFDYGIVFGVIIIVVLLYVLSYIVRGYEKEEGWVMLALCFFPLLLSHTYLKEATFFFLLGMCSVDVKKKRMIRRESNYLSIGKMKNE